MEPITLAAAVTSILSPFLPGLLELAKEGAKKVVTTLGEKAGEITLEKAKQLWERIKTGDNGDVEDAARLAARKPEDEDRLKMLVQTLAERLQSDRALANELSEMIGGEQRVQEILATSGSQITNVIQSMKGSGSQSIRADGNSKVDNVRQVQE